jgi:hypothetical protein
MTTPVLTRLPSQDGKRVFRVTSGPSFAVSRRLASVGRGTPTRERRVGRVRSALDDAASRRPAQVDRASAMLASVSKEEERILGTRPGASEGVKSA